MNEWYWFSRPTKPNSLLTVGKAEKLSHCRFSKMFRNWLYQVSLEMRLKVGLKIGGLVGSLFKKQLNPQLHSQTNSLPQSSGLASGVGGTTQQKTKQNTPQNSGLREGEEGGSNLLKRKWLIEHLHTEYQDPLPCLFSHFVPRLTVQSRLKMLHYEIWPVKRKDIWGTQWNDQAKHPTVNLTVDKC